MKKLYGALIIASMLTFQIVFAQSGRTVLEASELTIQLIDGKFADGCIYTPIHKDMHSRIAPPKNFLQNRVQTANFVVTYNGFTSEARAAFQFAVDIWASILISNWPINVNANWESLGSGVLGQAGPGDIAIVNNQRLMTVALAESISESHVNGANEADINATFNSDLSSWYLGTDGQTPSGRFDFVTVVLHELGHGLGFIGSLDFNSGQGDWGFNSGLPLVFDERVENGFGQLLIDTDIFQNPSSALGSQLISDNLFFNGPLTNVANGGTPAKLFAPNPWEEGSSFSHLNESTYPAGNINALLTPSIGTSETIHNPGPVMLAMFEDMGWEVSTGGEVGIRWEEVFSSASIPAGWTTVDRDGDGETWNYVSQLSENNVVVVQPQTGTRFWESDFQSANGMLIDDWLISPQLPTIQNGDVLKFYAGAASGNFPDSIKVWVSETDNNIDSFTDEIAYFRVPPGTGNYAEFSFDLSAYEAEDIYIAINYYHTQGGESGATSNHVWVDHFVLEGLLVSDIEDNENPTIVSEFNLEQNYPNPFNPETNIRYSLPKSAPVTLRVFNILGQQVALLVNQQQTAGAYTVTFDGRDLSSGVYFYQLEAGDFRQVKKMLLAR
mgnify:CR=1 FL=1